MTPPKEYEFDLDKLNLKDFLEINEASLSTPANFSLVLLAKIEKSGIDIESIPLSFAEIRDLMDQFVTAYIERVNPSGYILTRAPVSEEDDIRPE